MRSVILAALALTPMLLHAQANSPAQTQTSGTSTLQSKLIQPKDIASEADHGTSHVTTPIRVSTGVGAPKLVHTVAIQSDSDAIATGFNIERKTVVEMTVDVTGKPTDLKIVGSLGPVMDHNVLAAVGQYRFTPGTLDGQPAAVPVNLQLTLRNPNR